MIELLRNLCDRGMIRQLDLQFARFTASLGGNHSEDVAFIAGVLSHELSKGHICISLADVDLARLLGLYGDEAEELTAKTKEKDWKRLLEQASVVGDAGNPDQPLIVDKGRLYLQRYWYYEQYLAGKLNELSEPIQFSDSEKSVLREKLNQLFPDTGDHGGEPDWQKVAVAVALSRNLSVISGGPGTGKTTTVVKLLAALIDQGLQKGASPEIKLVAPTGKAAARLTESVGGATQSLNLDDTTRALMPESASTIHRLLGAVPNSAEFRHNRNNPLHLDILVVDEASMVDLPLMTKLTEALPPHARLILLGDKDQLASVEAGAVLGDICSFSNDGYSSKQAELLKELTGVSADKLMLNGGSSTSSRLSDSLCMLRKSYRFNQNSGIGILAGLINRGDFKRTKTCLETTYADVKYNPLTSDSYHQMIQFLVGQYAAFLKQVMLAEKAESGAVGKEAREALSLFSRCRLLCAIREGEFGLSGLNREIERQLRKKGLIYAGDELWYAGRPIMITRNDHSLGLYNGDIGITIPVTERDEYGLEKTVLKVFFELPEGSVKSVLPSRIPAHETAYAMTIHKSQGSEFPTTVMILPARFSPVISRELIYTGVTRARQELHIYSDTRVFLQGVESKTERLSGLRERLVSHC